LQVYTVLCLINCDFLLVSKIHRIFCQQLQAFSRP
jgi:hypothetical protein